MQLKQVKQKQKLHKKLYLKMEKFTHIMIQILYRKHNCNLQIISNLKIN